MRIKVVCSSEILLSFPNTAESFSVEQSSQVAFRSQQVGVLLILLLFFHMTLTENAVTILCFLKWAI